MKHRSTVRFGLVLAAGLWTAGAQAQDPAAGGGSGVFTGFWHRPTMLGDMGGLRSWLGRSGATLTLTETSEVLGNVSGGLHRGTAYDGLTQMQLQVDAQKAFGLEGGLFDASALQIHGRNLSADNLASLQTASGIEASRATRLWELWYQQAWADGRYDIKLGQQSLDQEFLVSQGSSLFVNTMMGWPMLPSADLYAGGPAYPLSSLGVRGRAQLTRSLTLLGGVFDDNPPGGPFANDSQLRDASGAKFNLNTGALAIVELQYFLNQPAAGDLDYGNGSGGGLPGTYKLGAWFDSAGFPDQRFDAAGRSLADPAGTGQGKRRHGNVSLYAVADQTVWRPDPQGAQALALFLRVMGAPGDRNLIDVSANGGVTLKAPLPGRDSDTLGLGFGVAKVSGRASALDRDQAVFGAAIPVRSTETFLELTYQVQLVPWWVLQPDFQYVFNPGAGVADSAHPGRRIADEAVLGLRMVLTF